MNPYEVMLACRESKKSTDKKEIIKDNESPLLKKVLKHALDPFITYGVKKFELAEPMEHSEGFEYNLNKLWALLNALSSRACTGNSAQEEIVKVSGNFNIAQQEVMRCILKKDLKCGLGIKTINAVFPNLINTFDVQLAQKVDYSKLEFPVLAEPKLDGVRCLSFFVNGTVTYYSRNGKEFNNFSIFDNELKTMITSKNWVIDGEVTGASNAEAFKGVTTQVRRKENVDNTKLRYHIFDLIPLGEFLKQECTATQIDRTALLQVFYFGADRETNNVRIVKGKVCNDFESVEKYYKKCLKKGYEGIILKAVNAKYRYKRSRCWSKIKPTDTIDVPIIALEEGEGKYEDMLGAMVVDVNGVNVNVGGGFTDKQRKEFWEQGAKLLDKIIEVKYDIKTEDGSLRFPRFVKLRPDKD